jgi:NADH-quinone oxidoreductase subunit C
MRKYTPKTNVQGRATHTPRFYLAPQVPRTPVEEDEHFVAVREAVAAEVTVLDAYIELNQLVLHIKHEENIAALSVLKNSCSYAMCSELSAIDYLAQDGEFEIFYQLLNLKKAKRVRVLARIKEGEAIETITPLYAMANFAEREMYDMYGITVNNHPYLKRILMPEDWVGHPLRKSYPLQGDEHAAWYEVDKIFGQEFRDVVGPELRDPSRIDRHNTQRFSRIGYEVPFGAEETDEKNTDPSYSRMPLVDYTTGSEVLDERK